MKIWMVNHYALPPSRIGGIRHYALAHELIKRGHEVTIVASSFCHVELVEKVLQPGESWKHEVLDGVPFLWIRTPPYTASRLRRLWNTLVFSSRVWRGAGTQVLGKPDIILGSVQHLFGAYASERLAHRLKVPFVFEVRDLMPQAWIDFEGVSPYHPMVMLMAKMERNLYGRSRRIIALKPHEVEYMVEHGAQREHVIWIPNGVDLSLVPSPCPPPQNEILTAVYVGSHGIANGLDTILDAAAILQRDPSSKEIIICLVGYGLEKPRLQRRAQEEGLYNVRFEDPVPKEQVHATLSKADFFLVTLRDSPMYRWGMSLNKIFDYLSASRPIVFGAETACNPVAEANAGIVVPPEDPVAMADAIRQLAAMSPEERWEMGLRGRRYVEEHHDFKKLAVRLEKLLTESVDEGP